MEAYHLAEMNGSVQEALWFKFGIFTAAILQMEAETPPSSPSCQPE